MVGHQIEPDLASILERSRAIADRRGPHLRLERDLAQIARESRSLPQQPALATTTSHQSSPSSAAVRLLSSYGSAPSALERKLHASALLDTLSPVPETDLPSLVAHRAELTMVATIQSTINETKQESMRRMMETDKMKWDQGKQRLVAWSGTGRYDSLRGGGHAGQSPRPFVGEKTKGRQIMSRDRDSGASLGSDSQGPASVFVDPVREAVESMSGSTRRKVRLASLLRDRVATGSSGEARRRRVGDLFMALAFMCREQGNANLSILSRGKFPRAASYLAWQMREKVRADIASNPIDAARGGVPGTIGDIRAWLSVAFARGIPEGLEIYLGVPLWGIIWYCMRVGDFQAALEVARGALDTKCSSPNIDGMEDEGGLGYFAECLEEFCKGHGISVGRQDRLAQEFMLGPGRSSDPYWRACVVFVAGGERERLQLRDEDYALLFAVIEDYLFLRLASVTGDKKRDTKTLRDVQEEVESFGPGHFDRDGNNSEFYALILVLVGRLPAAVKYLELAGEIETAVHVALVDQYYSEDESCCQMEVGEYGKIVWRFVSRFMVSHEADAVLYLMTIGDRELREPYLKRLILETRSFDRLLGRSSRFSEGPGAGVERSVGRRRVGIIEALWPLAFPPCRRAREDGRSEAVDTKGTTSEYDRIIGRVTDWRDVAGGAARDAEVSGDREAALRCFEAAGEEENVIRILTEAVLGEMASGMKSRAKLRILENARRYLENAEGGGLGRTTIGTDKVEELKKAVGLYEFFEYVEEKTYEKGWEVLLKVGVLPVSEEELVAKVAEVRNGMLAERIDEVLMAAITCLMEIMRQDAGRGRMRMSERKVKEAVKTLVNFGGMLGTSAEVGSKLVKIEAMML